MKLLLVVNPQLYQIMSGLDHLVAPFVPLPDIAEYSQGAPPCFPYLSNKIES